MSYIWNASVHEEELKEGLNLLYLDLQRFYNLGICHHVVVVIRGISLESWVFLLPSIPLVRCGRWWMVGDARLLLSGGPASTGQGECEASGNSRSRG